MIILIGPSAGGKTEIAKNLEKNYQVKKAITYTTRSKRVNEVYGKDYYFVSKEKFKELIKQNFFVEYTFFNDNYYGTSFDEIKCNRCVVLDPNGAVSFKNKLFNLVYVIYIDASLKTREERMRARLDDEDKIVSRLQNDSITFHDKIYYDLKLTNENISIDEITKICFEKYNEHMNEVKCKR